MTKEKTPLPIGEVVSTTQYTLTDCLDYMVENGYPDFYDQIWEKLFTEDYIERNDCVFDYEFRTPTELEKTAYPDSLEVLMYKMKEIMQMPDRVSFWAAW